MRPKFNNEVGSFHYRLVEGPDDEDMLFVDMNTQYRGTPFGACYAIPKGYLLDDESAIRFAYRTFRRYIQDEIECITEEGRIGEQAFKKILGENYGN